MLDSGKVRNQRFHGFNVYSPIPEPLFRIYVPIEVRLTDDDSETYELIVRNTSVPAGSTIYGSDDGTTLVAILPDADGNYILDETDVENFYFQAPLHWSGMSFVHVSIACRQYVVV